MKLGSDSGVCKHIKCKQNTKNRIKIITIKNKEICVKKYQQKYLTSTWKPRKLVETDTKSEELKSRTKKYSETRAAASKIYHVKIKQICTKHQKYHAKITKHMKSHLQENFWWYRTLWNLLFLMLSVFLLDFALQICLSWYMSTIIFFSMWFW